jgi:hypothetical protein
MSNVYWLCVHPEACILELECRERVETCVHVYWSGNDRRSCVVELEVRVTSVTRYLLLEQPRAIYVLLVDEAAYTMAPKGVIY